MKKIVMLIGLIAILLVVGCTPKVPSAAPMPTPYPSPASEINDEVADEETDAYAAEYIVEITSSGFSPKTRIVDIGETVTFINRDTQKHWPASNMHPVHNTYPGSGIEKCQTEERNTIFDACAGLAEGESFSFTFTEKGNWPFHDHLHPSVVGVVTVR
ncbi:MAG TPA: hypothetical protein VJI32_01935 [Candidatus Nanoarchaeia archaeon]|nr:hypothetical protein [Candidatus Nanoarchaeia archaeon]